MCLEDLRLGRGREAGQSVAFPDTNAGVVILPANPNRVSLLISCDGSTGGSIMNVSFNKDSTKTLIVLGSQVPIPTLLRIEDIGQCLTAQLFGTGNGLGQLWNFQEVLSYVSTVPFARIEDKNK